MTANLNSPITDLLDASQIPGNIEFIENNVQAAIDTLLAGIFYKDLAVNAALTRDEATYTLTLYSKNLRQSLFGTGMELVFFKGTGSDYSEVSTTFYWRWGIKKYFSEFDSNNFSYTPESFIKIFLAVAGIQDIDEFFEGVVSVFLDDGNDAYIAFFNELSLILERYNGTAPGVDGHIQSIKDNLLIIKNETSNLLNSTNCYTAKDIYQDFRNYPVLFSAVGEIEEAIEGLRIDSGIVIDICGDVLTAALKEIGNIDEKFEKLIGLFTRWLGDISIEDLKNLLIPQFTVELKDLNMGLEFPRKLLVPMIKVNDLWQVDSNEDHQAGVTFTAGNVAYSTQSGFTISETSEFNMPRCLIPSIKFQVEFLGGKLDLSKKYNISEATADGRPEDFIGVYIHQANIYLPDEWFKFDEDGSTLKLYAEDIIIGTGGLSGTIGLESASGIDQPLQPLMPLKDGREISIIPGIDGIINEGDLVTISDVAPENDRYLLKEGGSLIIDNGKLKRFLPSDGELSYKLGKTGGAGEWEIGFNQFYIKFWQNKIQQSEIKGFLTIPNFKQEGKVEDLRIDVAIFLENNGDFRMTASPQGGLVICLGEDGEVFKIKVNSIEAGKDNEKMYLETSGEIDFSNNRILNDIITTPIEIKKLRIYSDGSFEIEGGSIPIPTSVHMKLGPVEVNVTNITLGAESFDDINYKYIGFDCGMSVGSGGLDLRGDGIKLYFNHDGSKMFLKIAGIGVDLVIPGTASETTAALIIKGYLSIKESEYIGAVSFKMPKIKLAGGAAMKMNPKIPAFSVDAFLELPSPIPLGTTGLGIYGFRGLFGLRYIADLPPGATSDPEKLFDFYTEKRPNPLNAGRPEKGLHLGKIVTAPKNSGTPISIGAGLSVGTLDAGRTFSLQAFLFLSLPEIFMISGRGNILSDRVSMISETEPPFFAYIAITDEFFSIGMGADYKIPEKSGEFLELHAEAKVAFFFKNAGAWYINLGTKQEPNTAKVLKKIFNLDAYAYLMLSAAGIETGAGIKFELSRKYGPVAIEINAYGDINAKISFYKPQVGGGIACGGSIRAHVFGCGFGFTLDAYLMMTVPKPFIIKGGVRICVKVDFLFSSWKTCVNIEFKWEFEKNNDPHPIGIIERTAISSGNSNNGMPVSAYHIGSQNIYPLSYLENRLPAIEEFDSLPIIPLDSFIDIQLKKPVAASNQMSAKIGGETRPAVNNIELVPPKSVDKQVQHLFRIEDISIKVWSSRIMAWKNYHPYEALDPGSYLQNVDPSRLNIGYWQKKGKDNNNLRILANSPFSYADNISGELTPEEFGVTAATIFCQATQRAYCCVRWETHQLYTSDDWHYQPAILFSATQYGAEAVPIQNIFNIPFSLKFDNRSKVEIILPEKCVKASLKLSSFAQTAIVRFYDLHEVIIEHENGEIYRSEYTLIDERQVHTQDLLIPITYDDPDKAIKKIVIELVKPSNTRLLELQSELEELQRHSSGQDSDVSNRIRQIQTELAELRNSICGSRSRDIEINRNEEIKRTLESELAALTAEADQLERESEINCGISGDFKKVIEELSNLNVEGTSQTNRIFLRSLNKIEAYSELSRILESTLREVADQAIEDSQAADEVCRQLIARYCEKIAAIKWTTEKLNGLEKLSQFFWADETDKCSTYLHEICYLTEIDYLYNESIPSQAEIDNDFDTFNNAVSKVIAPIWRPDEIYAVQITANELISSTSPANLIPHQETHYIAFRTNGPIGHFPLKNLPKEVKSRYGLQEDGTFRASDPIFPGKIEIAENALKFYLDYERSYPSPVGNILNQKPLYYNNPKLLIFFTEPFVYHFFNNWKDYAELGKRYSSMRIEIKDSSENIKAPNIQSVINIKPAATSNWEIDPAPPVKQSVEVMNNLRDPRIHNPDFNQPTCWQIGGDRIIPASRTSEIKAENLQPSKLYTAVIFNQYSTDGIDYVESQVHSYPFQTSRYANLAEQVNSYHQENAELIPGQTFLWDAIDRVSYNFSHYWFTFEQLLDIASHKDEISNYQPYLIQNYPDRFQRLIFGYLKQKPLAPAISSEFHLLVNENNELFGIWVRNPEPFNDPRMPSDVLETSIKLWIDDSLVAPINPLFSKDNSEIIILHNSLAHCTNLKLTFDYLVWNGQQYVLEQSVKTKNLLIR